MANGASFGKGVATGVVVGAAAAVVIGYLVSGSFIVPPERLTTAIVLTQDPSLGCIASDPDALWGRSNARKPVTWNITNNCNAPQAIQFRNFQEKNPNGTLGAPVTLFDPTPPPNPPLQLIPVATAGSAPVPVTGTLQHVHGNILRHIYKYEIWVGPTTNAADMHKGRDPDVEAWDQ